MSTTRVGFPRSRVIGLLAAAVALLWMISSIWLLPSAGAETPPTFDPPLGLPFAPGTTQVLAAGPHQNNVHQCTSSPACNSLDFGPASGTNFHVTAAAPGVVQGGLGSCAPGLVFI